MLHFTKVLIARKAHDRKWGSIVLQENPDGLAEEAAIAEPGANVPGH